MKILRWFLILCCLSSAFAQQAPWGRADIPVSSHDRVYAADQTSNTVSVIDPSANKLLGVIKLGDPVPGALSPLYRGSCSCTAWAIHPIPERWPLFRLLQIR